jgi:hypothetical protein
MNRIFRAPDILTRVVRSTIARRAALAVAAMTLLGSVVMGRGNPHPTPTATAPTAAPVAAVAGMDLDLSALQRTRNQEGVPDLFAPRKQWAPPAAAEIVSREPATPPSPPTAPPLPFAYLGKLIDGDKLEIFIAHGDEHYSVEQGKTIDGRYKVDKVTARAVTFIYLPLGTRQSLPIPASN